MRLAAAPKPVELRASGFAGCLQVSCRVLSRFLGEAVTRAASNRVVVVRGGVGVPHPSSLRNGRQMREGFLRAPPFVLGRLTSRGVQATPREPPRKEPGCQFSKRGSQRCVATRCAAPRPRHGDLRPGCCAARQLCAADPGPTLDVPNFDYLPTLLRSPSRFAVFGNARKRQMRPCTSGPKPPIWTCNRARRLCLRPLTPWTLR